MAERLPLGVALRVLFMGTLMFFLEHLFFRVLNYTTHYLQAMALIAYALAGVAAGGLLAARLNWQEGRAFRAALLGSWGCLWLALLKVLLWPSLGLENVVLVGLFLCPAAYIASVFQRYRASDVYLWDLAGGALAVVLLVAAHELTYLERILLCTGLVLAGLGLLASLGRGLWMMVFGGLLVASIAALDYEHGSPDFHLYAWARAHPDLTAYKVFGEGHPRVRSYDHLIGRVEVLRARDRRIPRYHYVSSAIIQDGFRNDYPIRYRRDPRMVGNLVKDPLIYIIGTSAQGVVKTARYVTPPENIRGSEVHPAVMRLMQVDFFKDSGYTYAGLDFHLGNALNQLARQEQHYDLITMMNTHSMGQMFLPGPPDWLHTVESYRLLLSRLTDAGYVIIEERPTEPPGIPILKRRLVTLYEALRREGATDPSQHLAVYSWHWNRTLTYQPYQKEGFTSIIVRRQPLTPQDRDHLEDWMRVTGFRWAAEGKRFREASPEDIARSVVRFHHLPGVTQEAEFAELFEQLSKNRVIQDARWDLTAVTDDRPFSALVDHSQPELRSLLGSVGWLATLLLLPIVSGWRQSPRPRAYFRLHFYQGLVGAAYILLEVYFMQLYQKSLPSPVIAFVTVLTLLLLSSALGARWLDRSRRHPVLLLLLALSLGGHLWLHRYSLWLALPVQWTLMACLTIASGTLMGPYLAWGLESIRQQENPQAVALGFASNSLGGTLALVGSLYVSTLWGFTATAGLGLGFYLLAWKLDE